MLNVACKSINSICKLQIFSNNKPNKYDKFSIITSPKLPFSQILFLLLLRITVRLALKLKLKVRNYQIIFLVFNWIAEYLY